MTVPPLERDPDDPDVPALLAAVAAGLWLLTARWRETTATAWARVERAQEEFLEVVTGSSSRLAQRAAGRRFTRTVTEVMAEVAREAREQLPALVETAWDRGARTSAAEGARAAAIAAGRDRDAQRAAAARAAAAVDPPSLDPPFVARSVDELLEDVLAATSHVNATTRDLVRRAGTAQVRALLEDASTPQAAARALAAELRGSGVSAIVYRNGARHGLAEYASMLVRTKTAMAAQEAGFAQALDAGVGWMQILDNPSCGLRFHGDGEKANGKILPVREAMKYPLSHPNCVRCTTARPDIRTAEQAASAVSLTTPGQDADQAYVEAERARRAADRATRRQWAARDARRPSSGAAGSPAARRRATKNARRRPAA